MAEAAHAGRDAHPPSAGLSAFEASALAAGGAPLRRDQLEAHVPLVRAALDRLGRALPPDVERETLVGCGLLALVEAAEERSPTAPGFEGFARLRIWRRLTECLLASRCFLPRGQVALQRLSAALDQAVRLGLPTGDEELVALVGEPLEAVREDLTHVAALMAAAPRLVLSSPGQGSAEERIARAICELPQVEQLVVAMYYFEDLSFPEIATTLELSGDEVEHLFGRAALLLRVYLQTQEWAA